MSKTLTRPTIDQEPIDRLEEKVKLLVAMIGRLRTEQARMADDHLRLSRELDAAKAKLSEIEGSTAEVALLKEERDLIRNRVSEMLEQLEALNL